MAYKVKSKKPRMKKSPKLRANYFEVIISYQAKPVGSKDNYETYHHETKTFKNKKELQEFLEVYKGNKKKAMFVDDLKGNSQKIGYVYGYKSEEYDKDKGKFVKYYNQDWVEIRKVSAVPFVNFSQKKK